MTKGNLQQALDWFFFSDYYICIHIFVRIFEFGDLGNMDPSVPYASPVQEATIPKKKKVIAPAPKPKPSLDSLPALTKPKTEAERIALSRRYIELIGFLALTYLRYISY